MINLKYIFNCIKKGSFVSKGESYLIVTSVRNEESWILEWIAYHQVIGFNKFLFYTNDNTDNTLALLQKLEELGIVHVRENILEEGQSPQKKAFQMAIREINNLNPDWVLCSDVDEYLVLKNHKFISDFINERKECDAIALNWSFFGSSGKDKREPGMTIERFLQRGKDTFKLNRMVKSIYKWNVNVRGFGPHRPWFVEGYTPRYEYPDGTPVGERFWKKGDNLLAYEDAHVNFDEAAIHHYSIRSKEEYVIKKARGNGMTPNSETTQFLDGYFKNRDVNAVKDDTALKHLDEIRLKLADLESAVMGYC